jgi:hypothetical protein
MPTSLPARRGGWRREACLSLSMRFFHFPSVVVVTGALLASGRTLADAPVAPSPEPFVADVGVTPASLTTAAAPAAASAAALSSAPLPLGPQSSTGPRVAPHQPLPDWRLLVALGGAFAALAGYRVFASRRVAALPPDVFEVLGEGSLGGQQSVRIVRFGPRTLLLGVSSSGCQTLAELTDPQATDAIVAACRGVTAPADRRPRRRETRA